MTNIQPLEDNHEIPIDKLGTLITNALKANLDEISANYSTINAGRDHHNKSQNWVKQLALELEGYYHEKGYNFVSFYNSREPRVNSSLNSIKEFLFDITVAEIESIERSSLSFISKPVWQIESEFEQRVNATIADFQKLIAGNAPFKMMVGPLNAKNNSSKYRKITQIPASYISGDLFFLFITHPKNWIAGKKMIWKLYKWSGKDWGNIIEKDEWKIENEDRSSI